MNLAVIPARGGSKRIPRKNIKNFCGKPIIAWSIQAALDADCFDDIIVSTDDREIADVAIECGAKVPFMRCAELADDHTPTIPVIADAIRKYAEIYTMPDNVCCIYSTAPLIKAENINNGLLTLEKNNPAYVFSATEYVAPVQRAFRITKQGFVEMFQPEYFNSRSQDLEPAFHDAGQFYWGRSDTWLSEKIFFSDDSIPLILPRKQVQDIDTLEDWSNAEILFQLLKKE